MNAPKIFKALLQLGTGQVVEYVCSFLRNVIVARIISPHDFGIASTFVITVSLLEMISNLSSDRLIVQAEDGDHPTFQETAQGVQAIRGIVTSLCILALAGPIARLFSVPDATWAFRLLAIVPFIKSFQHLDMVRSQRDMKFLPATLVTSGAGLVVTLVAWPLTHWIGDYSSVLWILTAQAILFVAGSHLVATRRYAWSFDSVYLRRILIFGWPLLVNGLLMFGIFQGDRFIIGSAQRLFPASGYTMADLGMYSAALTLAMAPTLMIANASSSLLLPVLARWKNDSARFNRIYVLCVEMLVGVSCIIAIPFLIAGGKLIVLIYGPKYAAAAAIIGWLIVMQSMRIVRIAPTLAAMAHGDTRNAMVSNFARTIALAGILAVVAFGGSLVTVAAAGFVGEVLALFVCVHRLQREHDIPAAAGIKPVAAGAAMVAATAAAAMLPWTHSSWPASIAVIALAVGVVAAGMATFFPGLRQEIWSMLQRQAGEGVSPAVRVAADDLESG